MRKPIKKTAGKRPGKPEPSPVVKLALTAEQKRQIKADRAINTVLAKVDSYTSACLAEARVVYRTGATSDKAQQKTEDARARMLDAVGKLRLIVCPEAAALKT